MTLKFYSFYAFGLLMHLSTLVAVTDAGTNSDTLDAALAAENTAGGVVNFSANVSLVAPSQGGAATQVRALQSDGTFTFVSGADITVNGNNFSLNGNAVTRGFFVGGNLADGTGSVTIQDLNFNSNRAKGGNGSSGGGGGMGAGGGLYVGPSTVVVLRNCAFINCTALGGAGTGGSLLGGGGGLNGAAGSGIRGGGGGFGGDGGTFMAGLDTGGGGGGASGFNSIGDGSSPSPGQRFTGVGAAGSSGVGGNGATGGTIAAISGGFGGGGGGGSLILTGPGNGGTYGGGGGTGFGGAVLGGRGGFGGGSGAGNFAGFGAGGGRGNPNPIITPDPGPGGFGGGTGVDIGGAGAGFGGAIFIEAGGNLTIEQSITFNGNSATASPAGFANTDPIAGFGTLGQDIFMMSESNLTFDINSTVTMPSPIQGNQGFQTPAGPADTSIGGLTKRGSGLLTLVGANTFTGTTTVEGGELRITSSVVTDVVVDAGGVLSGNFDILRDVTGLNGGNLTNSGTVSPGVGGLGLITLEGDYTQTASGTLLVDIVPGGLSDRLFMSAGSATLDGTLMVILNPGNYIAGTTYEIINAPTLGTEFANIVQVGILGDLVDIQVDYSSVILTIVNSRIFEDHDIQPGIPSEVARCMVADPITPFSDFAVILELLGMLDNGPLNKALITLSPVIFGSLEWINARNNSYTADLLSQRVFELCCSPRDCCNCECSSGAWVNIFGNLMDNAKQFDNLRPFDAHAIGALAGLDFCYGPCFWGGSIGYTHTHLIWKNQGGKGNLNSYYGALYGGWRCDCFSIDASAIGGGTDYSLNRRIVFSTIDRVAKSTPWGYFFTGHLGLKSKWDWCCTAFEPYALGDYHYFSRQSFKENGADSINLDVQSKTQHMARAEAGLKTYWESMHQCYCVAPYLGLSWVGEFPLHTSKQKARFTGRSCVMDVTSYDSSVQLVSPQGGIKWTCCDGASLTLGYKGLFNSRTRINEVEGRFEWIF